MTRAEAEAVPSLGVPVPHSHPVSLGFARTMGTHLQESEHASRVCRTPDGVLSALRDRATPRYLPGLRTCHAWVHATPPHLPRLPTCHPPAPATHPHLPRPRTCHASVPATPPHLHASAQVHQLPEAQEDTAEPGDHTARGRPASPVEPAPGPPRCSGVQGLPDRSVGPGESFRWRSALTDIQQLFK